MPDVRAGSEDLTGYEGIREPDLAVICERITPNLQRCLADAGLGCDKARFKRHLTTQYSRGRLLDRSLVTPILGGPDYSRQYGPRPLATRHSERSSYRRRLPSVALFGYEIGSMIHSSLSCGYGRRQDVARLSALFNLGISLFDRACDRGGGAALAAALDEDRLRRLIANDPRSHEVWPRSPGTEWLGSLLRVVKAFFADLHASAVAGRSAAAWLALTDLLIEAYRSEMLSADLLGNDGSPRALLAAASRKSAAPFEIILHIAFVCEGDVGVEGIRDATLLAEHLGAVFATCDDLADLERDLRSGDLNTIALRAGLRPRLRRDPAPAGPAPGPASIHVFVDEAIRVLCDNLACAIGLLEPQSQIGYGRDAANEAAVSARDLLLGYVHAWANCAT